MGETTFVDYGGMDSGAANFRASLNRFQGILNDLDRDIRTHLAEWEGGAREAYNQAQARWAQSAQRMENAIQGMGGAVQDSGEIHKGGDGRVASSWG